MSDIKLIAIDMDGTLLNSSHEITEENKAAILAASQKGIHIVISTGRPYSGIQADNVSPIGIHYAITANGAAIYRVPEMECLYSNVMSADLACPIIRELQKKDMHYDAFIEGERYTEKSHQYVIDKLDILPATRELIRSTAFAVDDLASYIEERHLDVQKMTLNFYPLADGTLADHDSVTRLLSSNPQVTYLCGGHHNLEFTKAGVTKGSALKVLADMLKIPLESTMAIGDTENDLDIIRTAGIGVAMGNAIDAVKDAADYVTCSNEESGVAAAIRKLTL